MSIGKWPRLVYVLAAVSALAWSSACGAATPTPTATPRPAPTPTTAPAATATPTPAPRTTPTAGPAATATPTAVATATPTAAPKPTATATPAPSAKRGGALRWVKPTSIHDLDVLQSNTGGDLEKMGPIYDGLVVIEPDRTISPAQAKSWEVSADGKTVTFRLEQGVQFHDGTPFNAAAVKNDLQWKLNADNKYEQRSAIQTIASIDTPDEYTVKLNMTTADALIIPFMAVRPGFVFSPTARDTVSKTDRQLNPVGAGSFKVKKVVVDSYLELEKWDKGFSHGKYPYVDSFRILFIVDPAVRLASYRAGDADIFMATALDREQLKNERATVIYERYATTVATLFLNPRFPPLDNVKVRKAMSMSIDRNALIQGTLFGQATPLNGFIGPAWPWAWDPNYKGNGYDMAGAKALMKEAGYANGFTLEKVTWARGEERQPIMTLMADQFRELKIDAKLEIGLSNQSSRLFRIDKSTSSYYTLWGSGVPDLDSVPRDHFYSQAASFMYKDFLDPAVTQKIDGLLDQGRTTPVTEPAKRAKIYRDAQALIDEHAMAIFLFQEKEFTIYRNYVKDYAEHPSGGTSQWFKVWLDK
ncbi:MAG: ABC transporter substrate-binding protein [Chloroflexi bacterium]|nr:ABC transporter substrate-binding protein [Chloroflexota bacterium]